MKISKFVLLTLLLSIMYSCNSKPKSVPTPGNETEPSVEFTTLPNQTTSGLRNVEPEEFNVLIDHDNTVLLDVRTPVEITDGKINGAIGLDYRADNFESELAKLDKTKTYLVYCRSGIRSAESCKIMKKQGFTDLVNLNGGIKAWDKYVTSR